MKIGFAGSFTIDPLIDHIGALLLAEGRSNPLVLNANYNQIVRTCLDSSSEFGDQSLDTIVLLWRLEDLAASNAPENIASAFDMLLDAVGQLRENFGGAIIVSLPPRPRPVTEGLISFAQPSALEQLWFGAMTRVSALVSTRPNVYTVDIEAHITDVGEAESLDYRKEVLYRQPYTEAFFARLAERIVRIHSAKRLAPKKCIAVDCDNTLWGGIIGEDGVGGVQLSDDYPGRPFMEFQRQLKVLGDSGIFLALCTKNNPDDVKEMFETHSSMAISLNDISVFKVNWQPKSENLKEIANELNIGLDAVVFVDDNPFELEEVRTHTPQVTCVQVPEDIADLPVVIREIAGLFDRLAITADDRKRGGMMRQEMERRELSQKLTNADFLTSLDLEVELYKPAPSDLARVTQLINKTNQFNVTTLRYGFEEVAALAADPAVDLYCASVRDKFGDYGLVGVGIVRRDSTATVLDALLMSCRVLGRGVETAMISHGINLAASRGANSIVGRYIPTNKNAMVADLFEKHGFAERHPSLGSEKVFVRSTSPLNVPSFLTVRTATAQ